MADSGQLDGMIADVNASLQAQQQQQGGGGRPMSASASLPRRTLSLVTSILMTILKTASLQISHHPKQSTLLFVLLTASLLAVHNAPKNGIVISNTSGTFPPFSRGHTTLLAPPVDYLERYCVSIYEKNGGWISSLPEPQVSKKKKSKSNKTVVGGVGMTSSLDIDTSTIQEDEVTVKTSKGSKVQDGFALVTTASTLITFSDEDGDDDEDNDTELIECMHDAIQAIIEERKFTEFIQSDNTHTMKFRSFLVPSEEDDEFSEGAVMAMKLLGDFGRYGVQPFCISYETTSTMDDEEDHSGPITHCVAFHTLVGGHFDGELRFLIEEVDTEDDASSAVAISVTLAIPSGGRALPIRLAEAMVSSLTQSTAHSLQIRLKQTISRRRQSKRYRNQAAGRASTKRHLRFEQEKAQEEMAAERKRKWKRNNKDAGRYTPTGCRGPSGGPKFGF